MLTDAVGFLRCPHCRAALSTADRVVRCERGHAFDVGRGGYVSLLPGRGGAPGDTAAVTAAREAFLASGHFDKLARTIASEVAAVCDDGGFDAGSVDVGSAEGCIVDVGAGTGWYLRWVLDRCPTRVGIAIDASKAALRRAARSHRRAAAVGADIWQELPVRSDAAAAVMNVFAPRNPEEMARVLHPRGGVVVVTPTDRHLRQVRKPLALLGTEPDKPRRLQDALSPLLRVTRQREHEHDADMSRADLRALVCMGPNAYHVDPARLESALARLPERSPVTVSVTVSVYRRP